MSLDMSLIFDRITSHAMRLGHFDKVSGHEPKNAPGNGVHAAVFLDRIEPADDDSGMASTSLRVVVNCRVTQNMLQEPQDDIDPKIADAAAALMEALSGDFTLGGTVRNIDLLGETGHPLFADAGYLEQDHKMYRAVMVKIPMIVNDVFEQRAVAP